MKSRILVAGYLSIDRIVLDGAVHEGIAGGAALYAALGARFAGGEASISAALGRDDAWDWRGWLARAGIDASMLVDRPGRMRRATLDHVATGERASPHHHTPEWWERSAALAPLPSASLGGFDALLLAPMPNSSLAAFVAAGRERLPVIVADTSEAYAGAIRDILPALTCFAPSLAETRLLCPGHSDDAAAIALAEHGANVLQKRGAAGAFAVLSGASSGVHIPAPATTVVDPTGAGDATVGALCVHLAAGIDFLEAAGMALRAGAAATTGIGPAGLGFVMPPPVTA